VHKKNTFSPLRVKNKPRNRDPEHAFILGSIDCTFASSFIFNMEHGTLKIQHLQWTRDSLKIQHLQQTTGT
jgi:hypothetical protein